MGEHQTTGSEELDRNRAIGALQTSNPEVLSFDARIYGSNHVMDWLNTLNDADTDPRSFRHLLKQLSASNTILYQNLHREFIPAEHEVNAIDSDDTAEYFDAEFLATTGTDEISSLSSILHGEHEDFTLDDRERIYRSEDLYQHTAGILAGAGHANVLRVFEQLHANIASASKHQARSMLMKTIQKHGLLDQKYTSVDSKVRQFNRLQTQLPRAVEVWLDTHRHADNPERTYRPEVVEIMINTGMVVPFDARRADSIEQKPQRFYVDGTKPLAAHAQKFPEATFEHYGDDQVMHDRATQKPKPGMHASFRHLLRVRKTLGVALDPAVSIPRASAHIIERKPLGFNREFYTADEPDVFTRLEANTLFTALTLLHEQPELIDHTILAIMDFPERLFALAASPRLRKELFSTIR